MFFVSSYHIQACRNRKGELGGLQPLPPGFAKLSFSLLKK